MRKGKSKKEQRVRKWMDKGESDRELERGKMRRNIGLSGTITHMQTVWEKVWNYKQKLKRYTVSSAVVRCTAAWCASRFRSTAHACSVLRRKPITITLVVGPWRHSPVSSCTASFRSRHVIWLTGSSTPSNLVPLLIWTRKSLFTIYTQWNDKQRNNIS